MKIEFPNQQKIYLQNNRTNVFPLGNIWSSLNLDLQSNLGVLRISPRLKMSTSTADDANLGCPVAFRCFDTKMWAICGTRIFSNSGEPDDSWTVDSSGSAQTDYSPDESDMENFNGTLCATTTDSLWSKAANGAGTGAWTQRDTLSGGSEHIIFYFKKYDRLYYSNLTNRIWSIDNTWVVAHSTTTVPVDYSIILSPSSSDEYMIACARASSSFCWIGTVNNASQGRPGKVVQWDGISQQVTDEFELNNAQGALSIAIEPVTDSPYVMDSNGILSAWTGSGFSEVGRLPFPFSKLPYNVADSDNERFIHPNGSYFTKNGTYRCVINNRANSGNIVENMPSGVWEWTKDQGFVHIQSFSYNPVGSSTITDYGQNRIARVGAIVSMNVPSSAPGDGTFMTGATIYTNASSTTSAIFIDNSNDTVQKKGYFVTTWFESDEIASSFDVWWTSFRKRLDSGDTRSFKYRTTEADPTYFDITWVNTTSFTTSTDLSAYWTSGTGGEVEIMRGTGGSCTAHITNITGAGPYTVTIDEAATGVTTGTASARAQSWIKLFPAEELSAVSVWSQYAVGTDSTPRIQIKGCFTFTGAGEYYKGILTSNEDITTQP